MGHPVQGWSETCPWIFSDVRTLKQCLVRLSTGAARARRWRGAPDKGKRAAQRTAKRRKESSRFLNRRSRFTSTVKAIFFSSEASVAF